MTTEPGDPALPESPGLQPPQPPPPMDPVTSDREALRDPTRVSPFGPLFLAWRIIRQIGFLNIGIFTAFVGSRNFQLVGLASSAGLLAIGAAQWWRFTYSLEPTDEGDQLIIVSGVLSRNRTSVPLDRIQAVSTRQNLLHRMLNLVEVKVQTAGSAGAEVELAAVHFDVAERIRRLSTATQTSGQAAAMALGDDGLPPPPPEAAPVLKRSLGDVLVIALTRNPLVLLAPIPVALGVGSELDDLLSRYSEQASEYLSDVGASVAGVIVLVLAVLLLSAAVSVAFVVLRLFDLRLFIDGAGLRRLSGLISRTEITASRERVQLVAVKTNPLERILGLRELVLPVAGGGASVQLGAPPSSLQLPGTKPDELEHVADVVLGSARHTEPGHATPQGISPLATQRWTFWIGFIPAITASIVLWFFVEWVSLAALAWVPLVWYLARLRQASWRWSLGPETLRVRSGVFGELRREMAVRKCQNVSVYQGIFHRRHGLADVKVRTASRVEMHIPLLPLDQARAIRDEMLYRSESDPRPFM